MTPLPQIGYVLTLLRHDIPRFRITVTDRNNVTITGKVEEVVAWYSDDTPMELNLYLTFYMKWDGCCHVWFGERVKDIERNVEIQDGYLHLCGSDSWENHIWLMAELRRWGEKAIPMNRVTSGDSEFTPSLDSTLPF